MKKTIKRVFFPTIILLLSLLAFAFTQESKPIGLYHFTGLVIEDTVYTESDRIYANLKNSVVSDEIGEKFSDITQIELKKNHELVFTYKDGSHWVGYWEECLNSKNGILVAECKENITEEDRISGADLQYIIHDNVLYGESSFQSLMIISNTIGVKFDRG